MVTSCACLCENPLLWAAYNKMGGNNFCLLESGMLGVCVYVDTYMGMKSDKLFAENV